MTTWPHPNHPYHVPAERKRMATVIPIPAKFTLTTSEMDLYWIVQHLADAYFKDLHAGPHVLKEFYAIPGYQLQDNPFSHKRWVAFMVQAETR